MSILTFLKELAGALAAPARDPRVTYQGALDRHRGLIQKVRQARANLNAAHVSLEAQLVETRRSQPRVSTTANEDPFELQLSQLVRESVGVLEAELSQLEQEERELALVEERLVGEEQAFTAKQQALAARYTAAEARSRVDEELGTSSVDLNSFGAVLEEAERRADDVQVKVLAAAQVAGIITFTGGGSDQRTRELSTRYAAAARSGDSAETKRLLGSGFRHLLDMEAEYAQLQDLLRPRTPNDTLSSAYIQSLAAETYGRGVGVLVDVLSLITAIQSPGEDQLESRLHELEREIEALEAAGSDANQVILGIKQRAVQASSERLITVAQQKQRIEELLDQCERCTAALSQSRQELASLKLEGSKRGVEAAIASLKQATENSKEIQEELRRLDL